MVKQKWRKSVVINWSFMSIIIFLVWLIGSVTQAGAETVKSRTSLYLVYLEVLPVGDEEGHIVGTFSRKGLSFYENGEVATYTNWGTLDFIRGNGAFQGYSLLTFQDGSTQTVKWRGTAEASVYKLTGEYIKGTKRFEGIKGTFSGTGKALTPYSKEKGTFGDFFIDITGTYTLPSK
jgi:hypothetical protein